jgi:chemotaxis protein MotB
MAKSNAIIIKRIKKGGHAHHGGAWKVAYADFVTAMMAFFLLLWLLNATTDAQKRGIADYFSPTLATKSTTSGAGGVLGGQTMTVKGSQVNNSAPPAITTEFAKPQDFEDNDDDDTPGKMDNPNEFTFNAAGDPNAEQAKPNPNNFTNDVQPTKLTVEERALLQKLTPGKAVNPDKLTDQQFQALKAEREDKQFENAEHELQQAIQKIPDLKPLAQNLVIDRTEEGLRIQLVDQEKNSMFPLGSTEMNDVAKKLMGLVAQAITQLPNKVSITGHTDSTPFSKPGAMDNWDLSTQRANASRRALMAGGLPTDRISTMVGKADTEPFVQDHNSPQNRRVSIVVLRDAPPKAAEPAVPGASAPSTVPAAIVAIPPAH